jgi:hypothetical protein
MLRFQRLTTPPIRGSAVLGIVFAPLAMQLEFASRAASSDQAPQSLGRVSRSKTTTAPSKNRQSPVKRGTDPKKLLLKPSMTLGLQTTPQSISIARVTKKRSPSTKRSPVAREAAPVTPDARDATAEHHSEPSPPPASAAPAPPPADAADPSASEATATPANRASLAFRYPELAKEFCASNAQKSSAIPPELPLLAKWNCTNCTRSWEMTVFERAVLKAGCPHCSDISLKSLRELDSVVADELHPTKNDPFLTADRLTVMHRPLLWWRCSSCQGEFQANIRMRVDTRKHSGACPHCIQSKDPAAFETLSKEWHPTMNGDLTPAAALNAQFSSPLARQLVWWLCPSCAYEWQASAVSRNRGYGMCPSCNPERSVTSHLKKIKRLRVVPSGPITE